MTNLKKPYPTLGPIGTGFNRFLEGMLEGMPDGARLDKDTVMLWHQVFLAGAATALGAIGPKSEGQPIDADAVAHLAAEAKMMNDMMKEILAGKEARTWH